MTEGMKIILKPELTMMFLVGSEKHSVREGNTQKSSIITWKWFI